MGNLIVLLHGVHETITVEQIRPALPADGGALVPVPVVPATLELADTAHADWTDLRRKQEAIVDRELQRLLGQHPEYDLAYFGLAPVPLAMHLGYLVDRWRKSRVYQRHHETRAWSWAHATEAALQPVTNGLPGDLVRSPEDVVVRVSVTATVSPLHTSRVVPACSTEVDVASSAIGEDVIRTESELEAIAASVKAVLDRLVELRPNARTVHLFAAVPAGLAFRLGTLVSATRHPRVQTYQYVHGADPPHRRAILLGPEARPAQPLSNDERAEAEAMRREWAEDLSSVRTFSTGLAERLRSDPGEPWPRFLLPREAADAFEARWRDLAYLHETPLSGAPIALDVTSVRDAFCYDTDRQAWLLGDDLLAAIGRRIASADQRRRAGRMLLLHEGVHLESHRLTPATAPAIRRFPKVLEEADYQADVWAMLHEYAYTFASAAEPTSLDARSTFIDIVRTAVDTMWAFNDGPDELDEMEIRRVNRYLIWYWQWLRIERCRSLEAIARVMARKPIIELAGPRVRAEGDRVFYELREPWQVELELSALLEDNGIARHGHGGATSVPLLIEGLRQRDGGKIRAVLASIVDQNGQRVFS